MSLLTERVRLGRYREYAVPDVLRDVATGVWSYARPHHAPPLPGRGHRLLPDTDVSVAVETLTDSLGAVVDARVVLIGPITRYGFFAPQRGYSEFAVRIRPEFCRDLFDVDPGDIADSVTPVSVPRLLSFTRVDEEPLQGVIKGLQELRSQKRLSADAIRANLALRSVRTSRGPKLNLASIATSLATSERHLRRLITSNSAFAPKQVQRIARFERATLWSDRQQHPDWARIAGTTGYYDQAHMIDEFRCLAGVTPAELWRERRLQTMAEISNHQEPST
jgi:AraC-like DNA-binding protein